jgi:GT2 family glycosyltransferase
MNRIGVVVIGRNEGERLRRCLESVRGSCGSVVYVDSGSTDGSVEMARGLGVRVIELDMSIPFTAARARNEGIHRLMEQPDPPLFVQFVDGDCEVVAGWLEHAAAALEADPKLAMVCGRNRERHPEASLYNRLCDLEWDTPVGETRACGGIAMARAAALAEVEGYDPSLIAGEEPEMCLRLRQRGWKIRRLDAEMTLHDAAMTRFGQWWKRCVRGGYAFAEAAALHGRSPERFRVRETRSIWLWGAVLPAAIVAVAVLGFFWPWAWLGLGLIGLYGVLVWRIYRRRHRDGSAMGDARLYAAFTVLAKFPQATGQMRYWARRLRRRQSALIEYK